MILKKVKPANTKEAAVIRRNKVSDLIFLIIAIIMAMISAITCITVEVDYIIAFMIGGWTAFLLLCYIRGRKSLFELMLILNIFAALILIFFILIAKGFNCTTPWKYYSQRKYVAILHPGYSDSFPHKLPKNVSDYRIESVPSILQGTGHFSVRFSTSEQQLTRYEAEYSKQAIYIIPFSEFTYQGIASVDEMAPETYLDSREGDGSIYVPFDYDFWEGHEDDSVVYVISVVHNSNHPRGESVIINKKDGMIEFVKVGY
ncbi:hypothetical protein [Ruminococcus flavefaciens]|uniref:hypothetical protein n=1 Tax=Ruminococcus flavefaciens TaxID=1265 RepID=UPI00048FD2B1|nr:hypothetical protein [Ruminococcus flavefaciens]